MKIPKMFLEKQKYRFAQVHVFSPPPSRSFFLDYSGYTTLRITEFKNVLTKYLLDLVFLGDNTKYCA